MGFFLLVVMVNVVVGLVLPYAVIGLILYPIFSRNNQADRQAVLTKTPN